MEMAKVDDGQVLQKSTGKIQVLGNEMQGYNIIHGKDRIISIKLWCDKGNIICFFSDSVLLLNKEKYKNSQLLAHKLAVLIMLKIMLLAWYYHDSFQIIILPSSRGNIVDYIHTATFSNHHGKFKIQKLDLSRLHLEMKRAPEDTMFKLHCALDHICILKIWKD